MAEEIDSDCQIVEQLTKSVTCSNIPAAFLDKNIAKKHFSQFGRIHSFTLRPKRFSCIVEYETEAAAQKCLEDGYFYENIIFDIVYTPKLTPKLRSDPDYIDPDVQMELDAMSTAHVPSSSSGGGGSSVFRSPSLVTPLLRQSDDMDFKRVEPKPLLSKRPQTTTIARSKPTVDIGGISPKNIVDAVAKNELETILKKVAYTSEEKYRILDARDKLIRLTTARTTDIKKVLSTKGVCPDMCPEKERLMREATHHVATFELEESSKNIMKHSFAVKQYARSSADQELVLAHELRPEPVLQLTMNYLLNKIVDLCEMPDTNLGDWFHFVWDRTRSIRKDLSQQELCSQVAVSLVEQCTRLHIHCAARLVAEEPQVFDQKINSENLTKCLQSLKYLYHDLNLRHEQCPNEAEFRAYVILLNLNDCQFFWEVKQLPHSILHSSEIRFAINVYLAVESNNYVKFFKLVRETTYMNACILLRYFTQVRVSALNAILKAYVPRGPITMNISYWSYILAFEDYEQTAQFFETYGLQCDRDADRVIFERNGLVYPDVPLLLERAINIVEHKRTSSVGEAIYGGPLMPFTEFERYEPHDSFDETGVLLPEAWTAEDQNYLRPPTPKRKMPHHPFREEENVFKIPMAPQVKVQQSPKPSIFTKLSPKMTPAATISTTPTTTTNTTPKATFNSGLINSNVIFGGNFQQTENKSKSITSTSFGDSIFGKPAFTTSDTIDSSKNIFSVNDNIFGQKKSTDFEYKEPKQMVPSGIFSSFSSKPVVVPPAATTQKSTNIFGGYRDEKLSANDAFTNKGEKSWGNLLPIDGTTDKRSSLVSGIIPIPKEKYQEETCKGKIDAEQKNKKIAEEKRNYDEKLAKEKEMLKRSVTIRKLAEKCTDDIIDEEINLEIKEMIEKELKLLELDELAKRLLNEIFVETIKEELEHIVTDSIRINQYKLIHKYFSKWHLKARRLAEQREKIENTPIWLSEKSMPEQVPDLKHPEQIKNVCLVDRYRRGTATPINVPLATPTKIDICQIVSKQFRANRQRITTILKKSNYWKCLVSLPDAIEYKYHAQINKWFDTSIIHRVPPTSESFFCEQFGSRDQVVSICIRKFIGHKLQMENGKYCESNDTKGTNAVLFFISEHSNLMELHKRYCALQQYPDIVAAKIGFVFYNPRGNILDIEDIEEKFQISSNINVSWFGCTELTTPTLCDLISECFCYLANKTTTTSVEDLRLETTAAILMKCLGEQLWNRISISIDMNPALFKAATNISICIQIFNTAIDHLIEIISIDLSKYPNFPHELRKFVPKNLLDIPVELEHFPDDWKNQQRQFKLKTFFESLHLKDIDWTHCTTELELQQLILDYVHGLIGSANLQQADQAAYQMIQCVLKHIQNDPHPNRSISQKLTDFSWIEAMKYLTAKVLTVRYETRTTAIPAEIIYKQKDMDEFMCSPWWLNDASPMRNIRVSCDTKENRRTDKTLFGRNISFAMNSNELDKLIARSTNVLDRANKNIEKYENMALANVALCNDLNERLTKQEVMSFGNKQFMLDIRNQERLSNVSATIRKFDQIEADLGTAANSFKRQKVEGNVTDQKALAANELNAVLSKAMACVNKAESTIQTYRRIANPMDMD